MQVDLKGQVALVTGGAQGIGRAIAERLAANGAAVAILDIDAGAADETAREIVGRRRPRNRLAGDVADSARMQAAVAEIRRQLGPISILVNNAGINTSKDRRPIHEYSDDDWNNILRVDLTGVFIGQQGGRARHARARRRADREHRLGRGTGAAAIAKRLRRGQGRRRESDALDGARAGTAAAFFPIAWRRARS